MKPDRLYQLRVCGLQRWRGGGGGDNVVVLVVSTLSTATTHPTIRLNKTFAHCIASIRNEWHSAQIGRSCEQSWRAGIARSGPTRSLFAATGSAAH